MDFHAGADICPPAEQHTTIELLRRRQEEENYTVYAEATMDYASALANRGNNSVWDEWHDLHPVGQEASVRAIGRVHVELAWLP